jgi:hypothetical protein
LHAANPVAAATVTERISELRTLAAEKSAAHRKQFIGRTIEAPTLHLSGALHRIGELQP